MSATWSKPKDGGVKKKDGCSDDQVADDHEGEDDEQAGDIVDKKVCTSTIHVFR